MVLIHIHHSLVLIPINEKEKILLYLSELDQELLFMTDWYVDELFQVEDCDMNINTVSRLLMDPERFRSDCCEEMSRCGMGAIYTRTSNGKILRNITDSERESLLVSYYDSYHKILTEKVQRKLDKYGLCLIIDAHSFSSYPLPHENKQSKITALIYALDMRSFI